MKFRFSKHGLTQSEQVLERIFEVIPGFISWSVILGMILLSFFNPILSAVIIIVFDFYWLLRIFYITIFVSLSYFRLSMEEHTDWLRRAKEIDRLLAEREFKFRVAMTHRNFKEVLSEWIHEKELNVLRKSGNFPPRFNDIYHVVIMPILREGEEILRAGIESIVNNNFPSKKIMLVMALEDRATERVQSDVKKLQNEFKESFLDILVIIHPSFLPGEAAVKGANVTFAAKEATRVFDQLKIPYQHVIASCFDADTVVSKNYFTCLTYSYLVCPNRERASFQPIPVYHNNIWEAPSFARILEIGSSFFLLSEVTNPQKLVTFSSHSMSFKALVDIDYWPIDMISDDSAIFWKAFIHYDGDYQVVPLYVTLSMDVVNAGSLWRTAVNVYKQKRRWAWGVENFPIVMRAFVQSNTISLRNKIRHGVKLLAGHIAWSTWPILLILVGWLPAFFSGFEFSNSVLYYSSQRITSTIFNLASVCLVASILLSLSLLPKKKEKDKWLKRIAHIFEWLLIPFIGIFFSAFPALDAQTRLMLGKYMEFWVTVKKRQPLHLK